MLAMPLDQVPSCRRCPLDIHPGRTAEDIYRALAGWHPAEAAIDDDDEFDTHVFASVIAAAAAHGRSVHDHAGLSRDEFRDLLDRYFSGAVPLFRGDDADHTAVDDEVEMVRDLLLKHRSTAGRESLWLAAMIARRAVEPNHLWEDLGLRDRSELSRLLARHFAPLARRNTRNMRWKRFFYRMMCEDDGLVMCTTPVCTLCADFELCFGEESGESRLARTRRSAGSKPAF